MQKRIDGNTESIINHPSEHIPESSLESSSLESFDSLGVYNCFNSVYDINRH